MELACRCHGLSGSCSVKTCWRKLPTNYQIGDLIKKKYDNAVKVRVSHDDYRPATLYYQDTATLQIVSPSENRLVYLEEATDYCQHRVNFTRGRQCLPTAFLEEQKRDQVKYSSMQEHFAPCEEFCCNGEFEQEITTVSELCNCRFVWCCDVVCEKCMTNVTKYHCTGWKNHLAEVCVYVYGRKDQGEDETYWMENVLPYKRKLISSSSWYNI